MHFQIAEIKKQPADVPAPNTIKFSGWGLPPDTMLYYIFATSDNLLVRGAGLLRIQAIRQWKENNSCLKQV